MAQVTQETRDTVPTLPDSDVFEKLAAAGKAHEMKLEVVKNILLKNIEFRTAADLKTLSAQIQEIKFFKERSKEG